MRNGEYELVVAPEDYPGKKYRGRYCYEHHLVWWQNTGSLPGPDEVIYHRNDNKRDNRFKNLEKKSNGKHSREHNLQRGRKIAVIRCPACGETFERPARQTHLRMKATSITFCSRACIGRFFKRGEKLSRREKDQIAKQSVIKVETRSGIPEW